MKLVNFKLTGNKKGVALITVMLILALATILAVSMSSRQQINIHRSSNIFNFEQAYEYISGAESWVQQILKRDKNNNDSFNDDWAQPLPVLSIEGGSMIGQIEDLLAKFNVNNLVLNGKVQQIEVDRFNRLLRLLGLPQELSAGIIDWIDGDENMIFSGAEDNYYLNLTPAYRTANYVMHDVSELLLIKGFDIDSYKKLRPFVCVLESGTNINVNTASAEVLSSLSSSLTLSDAENIIANRKNNIYKNINDFLQQPLVNKAKITKNGLSIDSDYFQLSSTAIIDKINVDYTTIFYRDSKNNVVILKRSRGVL